MNTDEHRSLQGNPPPLHFGLLKINKEAKSKAGSAEIVETLSHMLVREVVDALQLDHKNLFHENVSKIFTDGLPLVHY
jgi:hypothetical protein